MTIIDGEVGTDKLKVLYSTKNHSGVPVPVYAYGPGSENFSGFMENISFKAKIEKLLKFKK